MMVNVCYVTVTMFCNNVSVLCLHVIVTDYYVLIGEIACNKYPVLLLFNYLGAPLTETWRRKWHIQYNQNGNTGKEGTGCSGGGV